MSSYSCVYMVKEREFTKTNEEVIKVGYSNQEDFKRFKQYPKGSLLLFHVYTDNGKLCETEILKEFKAKFNHRKDIGNEYFEGDYNIMRRIIIDIVERIESENKVLQEELADNELINKIADLQCEINDKTKENEELRAKIEQMQKQMEEFNKYKMFYLKNNGTDTYSTQQDKLKSFIDMNYIITNDYKDRIKTTDLYNEYSKIAKTDIRIFIHKLKEIGIETMKTTGYNYFINIKAK